MIRSDNKHLARLNTMKVILNSVPCERLDPILDFVPDPEIVISGARELEILEAERLRKGRHLRRLSFEIRNRLSGFRRQFGSPRGGVWILVRT